MNKAKVFLLLIVVSGLSVLYLVFGGRFDAYVSLRRVNVELEPVYNCSRTSLCGRDGAELLVVVHTAPQNNDRRRALRETWLSARWRKSVRFQHVFLVGSRAEQVAQRDWDALQEECHQFNDVVVSENFVDNYWNLSLKALEMLRLTLECGGDHLRHLVKVDDDTFLNVPALPGAISRCEEQAGRQGAFIAGAVTRDGEPHRDPKSRYHVSAAEYNRTRYPPFVHGPAYVVSFPAISRMLHVANNVPVLHLEDVYLALLAEAANVSVLSPGGFHIGWTPSWAYMRNLVSSHNAHPELMRKLWLESHN